MRTKKAKSAYSTVRESLQQAIQYEHGETIPVRIHRYEIEPPHAYSARAIKEIRTRLALSQNTFAGIMGVSKKTVEAWESGINSPKGPALRLLRLLDTEKNFLTKYQFLKS